MDWLNDSWLIGVIGGLLSGAAVTIISGYCLGRRQSRLYFRKIAAANNDLILSIKPGISENFIPGPEVFAALINATSRRYLVDPSDLYSPAEIAEELTKEIMGSSFIPARAKEEYCKQLEGLRVLTGGGSVQRRALASADAKERPRSEMERYRARLTRLVSLVMGGFAWLLCTAVFFLNYLQAYPLNLSDFTSKILFMAALIILAAVISCLVSIVFGWLENLRGRKPKSEDFYLG